MTNIFHSRPDTRVIEISITSRKKIHSNNQGTHFIKGSFINGDNIRMPVKYRRESLSLNPKKDAFSQRLTHPFFHEQHQSYLNDESSYISPGIHINEYISYFVSQVQF